MKPKLSAPQFEALIQAINLQDDVILMDLNRLYAKGVGAKTLPMVQELRLKRQELMGAKVWVLELNKPTLFVWMRQLKTDLSILFQSMGYKRAHTVQK